MKITEIYGPLEIHLEEFNLYFKSLMKTDVPLLNLIIRYITKKKGKQIRPALVIISADLCGKVSQRTYIGAAMIELLHTATLIHDDVVDESSERRGLATINSSWNNKIAVLVGDYLLGKGLLSAIDNDEFEFLRATSDAVRRMSEGEIFQIQKSKEFDIDEASYFRIISDKTASLISTCTKIGAISATNDRKIQDKLKSFGEKLGMAFQIRDDIFDYISKSTTIGKPIGNDIKERKITLPLIYSLRNSNDRESKEIIKTLKKNKILKKDIAIIVDFVKRKGGIDYAMKVADDYIKEAINELDEFPKTEPKLALVKIAEYAINRNN